MSYEIRVTRPAQRDVRALPLQIQDRIRPAVRALADDPRPPGSEKLSGSQRYRIRIGDYRVVYEIADAEQVVVVEAIRHRKDVYRRHP